MQPRADDAYEEYMPISLEEINKRFFPQAFMEAILVACQETDTSVSLRAGQPPNLGKGYEVSPKPMAIKTKTCTTDQGIRHNRGRVLVDQATFGRGKDNASSDELEHLQKKLRDDGKPEEAEKIGQRQLRENIREIEEGIRRGEYKVGDPEFKMIDGKKHRIIYAVLNDEQQHEFGKQPKPEPESESELKSDKLEPYSKEWRNQIAYAYEYDPEAKLDDLVGIKYCLPGEEEFKDQMVITYEGHEVTGDADMFAVALPVEDMDALCRICKDEKGNLGNIHQAFDTSDEWQLRRLTVLYLLIKQYMESGKVPDKISPDVISVDDMFKVMNLPAVQSAGIITPHALYVMLLGDRQLEATYEEKAPGCAKMLRHGAENHNPGNLADLSGKVNLIHEFEGQFYISTNERALRDFYLDKYIPAGKFVHVHPGWSEDVWRPVIEKEIEKHMEHFIDPVVFKKYNCQKMIDERNEREMTVQQLLSSSSQISKSLGIPPENLKPDADVNESKQVSPEKRRLSRQKELHDVLDMQQVEDSKKDEEPKSRRQSGANENEEEPKRRKSSGLRNIFGRGAKQ